MKIVEKNTIQQEERIGWKELQSNEYFPVILTLKTYDSYT